MPKRIQTPCSYPGCKELSNSRFCKKHTRIAEHENSSRRGTSAERGYDARHRRWRTMVLNNYPVCNRCKVKPSTVADHIEPLDNRNPYDGNWSLSNGQGLCHACHNKKTAEDKRRSVLDR